MSGAAHEHPPGKLGLGVRPEFLVDGCPRCEEYVENMGRSFDPIHFREFWDKMVRVEWGDDHWHSNLDAKLGRNLYLVSLQFQAAFGIHPSDLATWRKRMIQLIEAIPE